MYIVLEGMDCTGKTTLAKAFANYLRNEGYSVLHIHEPYKNLKGLDTVRELITDSGLTDTTKGLLALASRIELFKKSIEPALEKDRVVISERSFISTLVYQGGNDPQPLAKAHKSVFEHLDCNMYPDVVVHLENTHSEFLERIKARADVLDEIELSLLTEAKFNKLKAAYANAIQISLDMDEGGKTEVVTGINTAEGLFEAIFK